MKFVLIVCIAFLTASQALSQTIDRIVVKSRMADEPPTRQGADEYVLELEKDNAGRFTAKEFHVNNKKRALSQPALITDRKVGTVNKWIGTNKKSFSLHDLDLTYSALVLHADSSKYDLTFDIPPDFLISIDSFMFCQEHALNKSISTGGFTIEIKLIYASGEKTTFSFDSNDISGRKFDLRGYLISYKLLNEAIPNEFPVFDFFSKKNLAHVLLNYQKTVECEGYYYREFTKLYPDRSSLENRMMAGWNFENYLKKYKSDSAHCQSQIDTLTSKVVYTVANVMAAPIEGYQKLFDEIRKIKYPHYGNLEGKLIFGFIVQPDGTITGQRVVKGIDNANWSQQVFEAIARVKWKSGRCNGKPVDMLLILPIGVHTR